MLRFIYFCMAIVAISFLIVPLFSGVNQTRENLAARTSLMAAADTSDAKEMAAIEDQLNNIQPAAGEESSIPEMSEEFSAGFEAKQHPAF